jgi:hypothetical protein
MSGDFALYHWAPASRRKQILRYGLRPMSVSSCRQWKPPYVCLADGPRMAWDLIGRYRPFIQEWDLWWTASDLAAPMEMIPADNGDPREYRVYHRIYKRDIWFVGTRISEHYDPKEPWPT